MAISFLSAADIKEKFALLISKLHEGGFLAEYINQVIVESSFFDCFENNDLSQFMSMSFESITKEIFGKEVIYGFHSPIASEYYWAGLTIMDVVMNCRIPLKRFLLLCPLPDVIALFDPFHEMHPIQFCKHYIELEEHKSLFRLLREESGLNTSKIGFLTGINVTTLRTFDRNNSSLFATSFQNLEKLAHLFGVSADVFKKESSFVPLDPFLFGNVKFREAFVANMMAYFNFDMKDRYLIFEKTIVATKLRGYLKDYKYLIDISNPFGVIYLSSNRVTNKYLNRLEFSFLYRKTALEFDKNEERLLY